MATSRTLKRTIHQVWENDPTNDKKHHTSINASNQPIHSAESSHQALSAGFNRMQVTPVCTHKRIKHEDALSLTSSPHASPFHVRSSQDAREAFDVQAFTENTDISTDLQLNVSGDIDNMVSLQQTLQRHQQQQQQHHHFAFGSHDRSARVDPTTQVYTYEQVKRIVQQSLQQQEEKLRAEYDLILHKLLREQFESFSSFNRDYISRQLSKNDFSYLS